MQEIKPAYVNFTQAKLLKIKEFNLECDTKFLRGEPEVNGMNNRFFGEPLEDIIERPEQWQVVEWLRLNHNIDLTAQITSFNNCCSYTPLILYTINKKYYNIGDRVTNVNLGIYRTPQEALSKGIDYIIEIIS